MEPRKLSYYFILVSFVLLSIIFNSYHNSADAFSEAELSSKIDADLFLEDEGSGHGRDDLESSGSGNGEDDEDSDPDRGIYKQPKKDKGGYGDFTPSGGSQEPTYPDKPKNIATNTDRVPSSTDSDENIFNNKHETGSFFSQPGILAAIICGAIVGLLCAILLVMFIVYRMRKKDEGSYVLEDSKRTTSSYGKSKEFYA